MLLLFICCSHLFVLNWFESVILFISLVFSFKYMFIIGKLIEIVRSLRYLLRIGYTRKLIWFDASTHLIYFPLSMVFIFFLLRLRLTMTTGYANFLHTHQIPYTFFMLRWLIWNWNSFWLEWLLNDFKPEWFLCSEYFFFLHNYQLKWWFLPCFVVAMRC